MIALHQSNIGRGSADPGRPNLSASTLAPDLSIVCKAFNKSSLLQMEEKYGCLRMVVLWLFSSLGGAPATCLSPSLPGLSGLCIKAAFLAYCVTLGLLCWWEEAEAENP